MACGWCLGLKGPGKGPLAVPLLQAEAHRPRAPSAARCARWTPSLQVSLTRHTDGLVVGAARALLVPRAGRVGRGDVAGVPDAAPQLCGTELNRVFAAGAGLAAGRVGATGRALAWRGPGGQAGGLGLLGRAGAGWRGAKGAEAPHSGTAAAPSRGAARCSRQPHSQRTAGVRPPATHLALLEAPIIFRDTSPAAVATGTGARRADRAAREAVVCTGGALHWARRAKQRAGLLGAAARYGRAVASRVHARQAGPLGCRVAAHARHLPAPQGPRSWACQLREAAPACAAAAAATAVSAAAGVYAAAAAVCVQG